MAELQCTLEELYAGSERTVPGDDREVTVQVVPGWSDGTTLSFAGKKMPRQKGSIPAEPEPPMTVTIRELPHGVYSRHGNDLHVRKTVSLCDALTGFSIDLRTLDDRKIKVPVNTVLRCVVYSPLTFLAGWLFSLLLMREPWVDTFAFPRGFPWFSSDLARG
jgi:DnaJ homolog subfamily B member 4